MRARQARKYVSTQTPQPRKHASMPSTRKSDLLFVKVRSNLTETALQNQQIGNIGFILG